MATGTPHDLAYILTQPVVPKMEQLHYLTVSDSVYCSWKDLEHRLNLPDNTLLAEFLIQHYNKTSALTLTQCVQCQGPLNQYCVKCNIYIGQPMSDPNTDQSQCDLEVKDLSPNGAESTADRDADQSRSHCSLQEACLDGSLKAGKQIVVTVTQGMAADPVHSTLSAEALSTLIPALDRTDDDVDEVTALMLPDISDATSAGSSTVITKANSMAQVSQSPKLSATKVEDVGIVLKVLDANHTVINTDTPASTTVSHQISFASSSRNLENCVKVANKTVTDLPPPDSVPHQIRHESPSTAKTLQSCVKVITGDRVTSSAELKESQVKSDGKASTKPTQPIRGIQTRSQKGNSQTMTNKSRGIADNSRSIADNNRSIANGIIILADEASDTFRRSQKRIRTPSWKLRQQSVQQKAKPQRQGDLAAKVKVIVVDGAETAQGSSRAPPVKIKTEPTASEKGDLAAKVKVIVMAEPRGMESAQEGWSSSVKTEAAPKRKEWHTCEICGKQIRSKYELKGHLRIHSGERPYACSQCPARYTRPYHLKCHLRKHDPVRPFRCKVCPKGYVRSWDLKEHEKTHSLSQLRPHVCEKCGSAFKSLALLKHHSRVHVKSSSMTYVCVQCGAGFRWRSNYVDHVKLHTDERAFACPHCPKMYVQSGSLKKHLQRHHVANRPRPFVCHICGAARYERSQFAKHMMIHTGERPYKCQVCGAGFIQANALKSHMKIHTETEGKSNWCSLCGAAFRRLASIKKHMAKVHNDVTEYTVETVEIEIPEGCC